VRRDGDRARGAGAIHEEVDLDDLAPGDSEAGDPDQLAVAGHDKSGGPAVFCAVRRIGALRAPMLATE
jgi:hypothetical protein